MSTKIASSDTKRNPQHEIRATTGDSFIDRLLHEAEAFSGNNTQASVLSHFPTEIKR